MLKTKIARMAGNLISSTVLRKQSIYRYVNADGAIANCLNMAIAGSVCRVVCDICGQGFKGKKQAYKHLETHADVVMVKKNRGIGSLQRRSNCEH